MAKVIQVIETHERVGLGKDGDPMRLVYQLWTLEGALIFERDPHENREKTRPEWNCECVPNVSAVACAKIQGVPSVGPCLCECHV